MTKTEKRILEHVRECNKRGVLAEVSDKETRFAQRLAEAKLIVWVDWNSSIGKGWALDGHRLTTRYLT